MLILMRGWWPGTPAMREKISATPLEKAPCPADSKYRIIADNTYDWELWLSPEGRVVYCSPSSERITGFAPGEFEANPGLVLEVVHPDDRPRLLAHRRQEEQELTGQVEFRIRRRHGGERWIDHRCQPVYGAQHQFLGTRISNRDDTARKRAESESERLRQLKKEREDILRTVSHDLRSPLTAIQGQAQLLLRRLEAAGPADRARRSAQAIVASAQRMDGMIQDLVDAARLESGPLALDPRPIDLRTFTLDLKGSLAQEMDTGRIRVEAPEGLPPVLADPARLERILANLLSNALKYSDPGTEVTVTLEQREGEIITSVSDRGVGIPSDELPRVFTRYFRARTAPRGRQGLGLGLYITRMLVQAHGGRIWVGSEEGKGSTFSFSLPVA